MTAGLTCKEVRHLARATPQFAKLIDKNIIADAKNVGFPRDENKAKIYHLNIKNIATSEYNLNDRIYRLAMADSEIGGKPRLSKEHYVYLRKTMNPYSDYLNDIIDFTALNRETILLRILNFGQYVPADIIKGDLMIIPFPVRISFIFDGCDFTSLNKDGKFNLNNDFQVVKDNISVNYWFDKDRFNEGLIGKYKYNAYDVNFDHRPYRLQIIKSMKMTIDEEDDSPEDIEAYFQANGRKYTIKLPLEVDDPTNEKEVQDLIDDYVKLFHQLKYFVPLRPNGIDEDLLIFNGDFDDEGKIKIREKYF